MSHELHSIQEQLLKKTHNFIVYRNQVNKDLERSGLQAIEAEDPITFLNAVITYITELIDESDPKLQQLFYLADVQERHLKKGIAVGFLWREWIKVKFRLGHQ